MPHTSFPFLSFNFYPFTSINHSHECNSFLSPTYPFSKSSSLRVVLRTHNTAQDRKQANVKDDPKFSSPGDSRNRGSRTEVGQPEGNGELRGRVKEEAEKASGERKVTLVLDLINLTSISR